MKCQQLYQVRVLRKPQRGIIQGLSQIVEGPRRGKGIPETAEVKTYNESKIMQYQISKERIVAAQKASEKQKVEEKTEDTKMEIDEPIDENDPYAKIKIVNASDDDIQCDICLEFDHEDDDQIVICELCNAATH